VYLHTVTPLELRRWAVKAKPGDRFEYAEGVNTFVLSNAPGVPVTMTIAQQAMRLWVHDYALFQKRDGDHTTYIIQRLSPRSAKFLKGVARNAR
jgi:hypothetical protein